jgi:RNA polymerase sigma factor (sigma-70 family)
MPLAGARGRARGRPAFADAAVPANRLAVHRYLAHLTRDVHLAEDLTQETFERGLRRWSGYRPERGEPLPWLLAIARSTWLDHLRGERRRRAREKRHAAAEPREAPAPEGPAGLSPALRHALERLSDAEREVVALRVVLGLDGGEVAALLGISRSACSTTLHRAMTSLRRDMEHDEPHGRA